MWELSGRQTGTGRDPRAREADFILDTKLRLAEILVETVGSLGPVQPGLPAS